MAAVAKSGVRRRLYAEMEPQARGGHGLSPLNRIICGFIVLSTVTSVLETEVTLVARYGAQFQSLEILFTALFATEYVLRAWVAAENPHYGPGLKGRLKYVLSPMAVIDFLAFAPALVFPGGSETFILRLIRLMRILRLARLGRFSAAIQYLAEAVRSRTYELGITVGVALALLVLSSTLLYIVEGNDQPDAFGSIPRAMWWAAITLTTVGYGDVYPITIFGKIIASITALAGIGLIALPTGILASAFSDAVQRRKLDKTKGGQ